MKDWNTFEKFQVNRAYRNEDIKYKGRIEESDNCLITQKMN